MRVVKVAYTKQWIRRRRKCGECGVIWTSREGFDGARLDEKRRLVPEDWPVVRNEKRRRGKAKVQPDTCSPLYQMVQGHYTRNSRGVRLGEGSDGVGEVTEAAA